MKTLEKLAQLAHEYSEKFYGCEIMASDVNVAWFAGYETAQEHVHAALEEVEARIVELEDQIVGVSKVMNSPETADSCEHILDMNKMVDVSSSKTSNSCERHIDSNLKYRCDVSLLNLIASTEIAKESFPGTPPDAADIGAVKDYIEHLEGMVGSTSATLNNWISVKDASPEPELGEPALVLILWRGLGGWCHDIAYHHKGKYEWCSVMDEPFINVCYWQPLPEPPKEEG